MPKIENQNSKKIFFDRFWFISNHFQSLLFLFRADLIFKYPLYSKVLLCALGILSNSSQTTNSRREKLTSIHCSCCPFFTLFIIEKKVKSVKYVNKEFIYIFSVLQVVCEMVLGIQYQNIFPLAFPC